MRKVALNMITPEMKLGKSIYNENQLLLRQGTTNLQRYINKLTELDICCIYVDDSLGDDIEIPDAISEETRNKCKKALTATFERIKENSTVGNLTLLAAVDEMIEEIVNQPNIIISLQDIGSSKDETLLHSVNSAIYGLVLANRMGVSPVSQRDLAQGLLLHDIGKILLDQDILYKVETLTKEEFDHIKQHPVLGYEILKNDPLLTELSRRVALEHHERLDGSGYGSGVKGSELNTMVRIASIADVYEALTVNRCYRKCFTPSKAADILIQEAVEKLDANLIANFFQCIAIYPNGALLLLSNNRLAIVKEQNPGIPFRPIIRVIENKDGTMVPGEEIDLSKTLNITVIEDDPDLLSALM